MVLFGLVVATAVAIAFAPLVSGTRCEAVVEGPMRCASERSSLIEKEGAGILGLLSVPVLLALLPVVVPSAPAATVPAVGLTVLAVVGAMSVGIFLVPSVVVAWMAFAAIRRQNCGAGRS